MPLFQVHPSVWPSISQMKMGFFSLTEAARASCRSVRQATVSHLSRLHSCEWSDLNSSAVMAPGSVTVFLSCPQARVPLQATIQIRSMRAIDFLLGSRKVFAKAARLGLPKIF